MDKKEDNSTLEYQRTLSSQLAEHKVRIQRQYTKVFFLILTIWIVCVSLIANYLVVYSTTSMLVGIFLSSIPLFAIMPVIKRRTRRGCNCLGCQQAKRILQSEKTEEITVTLASKKDHASPVNNKEKDTNMLFLHTKSPNRQTPNCTESPSDDMRSHSGTTYIVKRGDRFVLVTREKGEKRDKSEQSFGFSEKSFTDGEFFSNLRVTHSKSYLESRKRYGELHGNLDYYYAAVQNDKEARAFIEKRINEDHSYINLEKKPWPIRQKQREQPQERVIDVTKPLRKERALQPNKDALSAGKCSIIQQENKFIRIQQNGRTFHYRYLQSQNKKFIVAWKLMVNYDLEKSNRVCLIENGEYVLWSKDFRRAWSCCVSDNGKVAVNNIDMPLAEDVRGRPMKMLLHSIVIIAKSGSSFELSFGKLAEVIAFALSPDGGFLIYNLQQYRPNKYELVFHNLETNREEWRYKYPQDQVIHELIFKEQRILAYSGPRPSAYIDRQYSFSLDLTGRIVKDTVQVSPVLMRRPRGQEHAQQEQNEEKNIDQSVYDDDPEATQEDDMEEDLALLKDEDTGW